MANLCEKHNLVIAADSGCVLCRRERVGFVAISRRPRTGSNNAITVVLGLGLLAAIGALVVTLQTPEPVQGSRYVVDPGAGEGAHGTHRAGPSQKSPEPAAPLEVIEPVRSVETAEPLRDQGRKGRLKASLRTAQKAVERAKHDVPITMYSTGWCTICETSRYYLEGRELSFQERDIEADPKAFAEMSKVNPLGSVPTFIVGEHALVGFNPWQLEDLLAEEARKRMSLTCEEAACQDEKGGGASAAGPDATEASLR